MGHRAVAGLPWAGRRVCGMERAGVLGLPVHVYGMAFQPYARPIGCGGPTPEQGPGFDCPTSESSYEAQMCATRYVSERDYVYCLLSWSQLDESQPGSCDVQR